MSVILTNPTRQAAVTDCVSGVRREAGEVKEVASGPGRGMAVPQAHPGQGDLAVGWQRAEALASAPGRRLHSSSCSVVSYSVLPPDCSPPGSSVRGILQARVLEWAACPFSRGSS